MSPGFSIRETMSGHYWRLDAPLDERAIAFTQQARVDDLRRFLVDRKLHVTGTIDAEGLATGRALEGTIALHLVHERRLPYRFFFEGDDQRRYELSGEREWSGLRPFESLTLLSASLYDDTGEEIGRATLRFDTRTDLWPLLKSFRPHLFG